MPRAPGGPFRLGAGIAPMPPYLPLTRVAATLAVAGLFACSRSAEPDVTPAPISSPASSAALDTARNDARSPAPSQERPIREFLGSYQHGFERSWFSSCDAPMDDRLWWVTLTDEALAQRDSLLARITAPSTGGLAVRWRGSIGPRMRAGHTGRGTRYMLVTKVLEVRPLPAEGACGRRT